MAKNIQEYFEMSAKLVLSLKSGITNDEKLKLYGLYKQSINCNCNISAPSKLFNPVDHAKYNTWNNLKGTSKEDAMELYVDYVTKMVDKYGIKN